MKNKILPVIIGISIFSLLLTSITFAVSPASSDTSLGITSPLGDQTVTGLVGILENVVKWVYTIFFILAVLFILMAAFTYLTSAGDEEKVKSAKNQIIYAAVAIAVALLAVGLKPIVSAFLSNGQ